jgi:hypothetical protein
MRQTIRALAWITTILWVITLALPVTVVLSLSQLMSPNAIGFQEPSASLSGSALSLSAPFYVNNTGFYDLTDLNATVIFISRGSMVAETSTLLPIVAAGSAVNSSYATSLDLADVAARNPELLFEDGQISLNVHASFRVAYVIRLGVSTNFTAQWQSPFYNLTAYDLRYDAALQQLSATVNFQNHAFFAVNGSVRLELYNNRSELIGSMMRDVDVQSNMSFHESFALNVVPSMVTGNGFVRVYFAGVQIKQQEWNLIG